MPLAQTVDHTSGTGLISVSDSETRAPFVPLDVQILRILLREATRRDSALNWRGMRVKEICRRLGVMSTIWNRFEVLKALHTLERRGMAYHIRGRWMPSTRVVVYEGFRVGAEEGRDV